MGVRYIKSQDIEAADFDVIVVGSGFAGCFCAHDLAKAGCRVLVLERRDRIGGSLYDTPDPRLSEKLAHANIEVAVNTKAEDLFELVYANESEDAPLASIKIHGVNFRGDFVYTDQIEVLFQERFGTLPYGVAGVAYRMETQIIPMDVHDEQRVANKNSSLYERYSSLVGEMSNFHLLGKLAEYRYYSTDEIIQRAHEQAAELLDMGGEQ